MASSTVFILTRKTYSFNLIVVQDSADWWRKEIVLLLLILHVVMIGGAGVAQKLEAGELRPRTESAGAVMMRNE